MITQTINQKIAEALKARDEVRLSTLRLLSSALNYEKIAKQHELSYEEEISVVRREAKKRREAIEAYGKIENNDKARQAIETEKKELKILEEYLPEEMSLEELSKIIDDAIKETNSNALKDMGKVIGVVVGKVGGRAEGRAIADIVRQKLG